jgi:type IX secretion system PorP/SprF family membrane protein
MFNKINHIIFNCTGIRANLTPALMFVFIVCAFKFNGIHAQQDPQYSQYMFNQFALNPACAGSREAISAAVFYRNQWTGIDGGPQTETFTIHGPMRNKKMALGFAVIADQIGPKSSIGALGTYAYRIRLGAGKLSMGVRFGAYQYTFNWGKVQYKDITENTTDISSASFLTADAGAYYYTNSTYAGVSVTHLNKGLLDKTDFKEGQNLQILKHYFFTAGKAWEISDKLIFSPSCMVKYVAKTPVSADVNLSFLIQNRFWAGISVRSIYGLVVYAQYHITDKFKFGYAYDMSLNKLGTVGQTGGSHEIMLSYDLKIAKGPFFSPRYF